MVTRSTRSVPTAWSREQIEAWIHECDGAPLSERQRHQIRLSRMWIVRLCPEVPDYEAFTEQVLRAPDQDRWRVDSKWRETATDDEIEAHETRRIAALWQKSLAEPVVGDAP